MTGKLKLQATRDDAFPPPFRGSGEQAHSPSFTLSRPLGVNLPLVCFGAAVRCRRSSRLGSRLSRSATLNDDDQLKSRRGRED